MAEWPLVVVRWILFADLGLLFGVPLFAAYALRGDERRRLLPLSDLTACLAVVALISSLCGFLLTAANMLGVPVGSVDGATLKMLLQETSLGWAFIARTVTLIAVVLIALALRGTAAGLAGTIALGAVALASLAWSGHGAASEGALGWAHLASDIAHLLAASAWIGALGAFLLIISRSKEGPGDLFIVHRALAGFATAGTVIVAVILLSGLVNSFVLIGIRNIGGLLTNLYGQLLLVKLVLFGAMLGLAASNRFHLTPALEAALGTADPKRARVRLRQSLWLEAAAGIAILALVAWFGTLEPPNAMG